MKETRNTTSKCIASMTKRSDEKIEGRNGEGKKRLEVKYEVR